MKKNQRNFLFSQITIVDELDETSIADKHCLRHRASEITDEFEDEAPYISYVLYVKVSFFSVN